ncbi:MAG: hypothetical protein E6K79_07445 [Candidatus Eisenbacteria bacterium]|uniref:Uncharacterized protein n=1 Tax=Eiseniibacteriota bacterium TaxID=2212470 RepID=A0A538TLR6_UNCEI|nr:MAG: hypothetical protein E6K79_07445 [Candidatus Eisenbacteria bacterium]
MNVRALAIGLVAAVAAGLAAGPPSANAARHVNASYPQVLDSYPRNGDTRVPSNATLYYVFDQPTQKRGSFEVVDLDSMGQPHLNLDPPTWSALGDTVFLNPTQPMTYGHLCGMLVDTIFATDSTASNNVGGIRYFRVFPRARLERFPSGTGLSSVTLVPEVPVPVSASVRELNDNTATFTSARIEFWAATGVTLGGGSSATPLSTTVIPVAQRVPRLGTALLSVPVTLPRDLARNASTGLLGLRVLFEGTDESRLPLTFEAFSSLVATSGDTIFALTMTPALVTPAIAANVVVQSAFVEQPIPGAVYSAGDTVRARAVVTGIGTGPFRAVFYLDGSAVAMEEGYMESGHPVTVEPRGPIVSRRMGEHRLQFVVESPQHVAAQPMTFLCVPPPSGLYLPPRHPTAADSVITVPPVLSRFSLDGTNLVVGKSAFRDEDAAGIAWSAWKARYGVTKTGAFEANVLWRLRLDDTKNGSASPEQVRVGYKVEGASVEWGDLTPAIAAGAPLFASPVPRRSAQAVWSGSPLGDLQGYMALESRPRSSAGTIAALRSDLYAGRLSRAFGGERLLASLYGGYTHDDATPGGGATATTASATYGGSGHLKLPSDWSLFGDLATVRHRTIPGLDPGRSRTAVRGELKGAFAGFAARAEAFRYQPDLATPLNPYAISDRKGGAAELSRGVADWRFFGSYRREEPSEDVGSAPRIHVDKITFGGSLKLNQVSFVTPTLVRIQNRGPNTNFTESRAAGELTIGERMGGQTRARMDIAVLDDDRGVNARRVVTSGSLVSTRKESETVTTTLSGGIEREELKDLSLTNQTIQAAVEVRWEAVRGKFLVTPLFTYLDRRYDSTTNKEKRMTGRLHLTLIRVPGLGENAFAVEGRVDRVELKGPTEDKNTEGSVQISFGQQFGFTSSR